MSSVRKRILPSGETRWQVDYKDQSGKRRAKQFPRKADAVAYETRVRSEIVAGTHVADSASVTVERAGELWIEHAELEGREASTVRQYRQHLKHHILPLIGASKLTKLKRPDIEAFRDELVATRSRPLARAILASLKGLIKEAQRRGLVGQNVASDTSVDRRKETRVAAEIVIPTKAEIRVLLSMSSELFPITKIQITRKREQKIVPVPWRPLLITALFTGLRCSEIRGLTWEGVDLDAGSIHVRQRADFQNVIGPPKSKAGNRDVPLAPIVINTLRTWREVCPASAIGLVFPTGTGTVITNSNIHQRFWRPLQRAAGTVENVGVDAKGEPIVQPRFTFHSLRHAAASLFIEQGWSPKKVQAVMGHSSIQMTFDTYGKLWKDSESDAEAMRQIEERLLA